MTLQPKQFGPEAAPEDQEVVDAANRRLSGASRQRGPIGPFDADKIDRNNRAVSEMSDFGMKVEPTFKRLDENRGFSVDVGLPDVLVTLSSRSRGGYSVGVMHQDRYKTNDDGSYAHPSDWGVHDDVLDVGESDLSGALMDHLARPDVRRHMTPPRSA